MDAPAPRQPLDYAGTTSDVSRHRLWLALSVALVPIAAALLGRGVWLDRRGSQIWEQRWREFGTIRSFFTREEKAVVASATRHKGWRYARLSIAASALGAAVALHYALRRRARANPPPLRPLVVLFVAHALLGAGAIVYWLINGVPPPYRG